MATTPTRLKEPISLPNLQHNEQVQLEDFQRICTLPLTALKNALTVIFNGQSGKFEGLKLRVDTVVSGDKTDYYVVVGHGFGIVTTTDDAHSSTTYNGSYVIAVNTSKVLFKLPAYPTPLTRKSRYRIFVKHATEETDVQPRNFIDVSGNFVTRDVPTLVTYTLVGDFDSEDVDKPSPDPPAYNELTLGYITVDKMVITIDQMPDSPLTLYTHQHAAVLDHPDGSVMADHLSADLSGGWITGDYSIKMMSYMLQTLQGTLTDPNSRISTVIDEDGNIIRSAVEDVVTELVQRYLANITDGQGNLSKKAIDTMTDDAGRPVIYRMGVRCGEVSGDDGEMPVPDGFTKAQTVYIVSIANLQWTHVIGSAVELTCQQASHGICVCKAVVKRNSDGTVLETVKGTANYLAIAIAPQG